MNTIKRIAWIFVVILILVSAAGRSVHAAETAEVPQTIQTEAGSLLVESGSAGSFRYEEGEGKLYIYGGTVSIRLNPAVDYSRDRIEVSGYATLVLSGVRILAENGPALRVIPGAAVEIRLAEGDKTEEGTAPVMENFLQGAEGYAGIEAETLPGSEEGPLLQASLRIRGKGYLAAVGGEGAAAIGASRGQYACGHIVIEEGNITAIAGKNADAIGCGAGCDVMPAAAPMISDRTASFIAFATILPRRLPFLSDSGSFEGTSVCNVDLNGISVRREEGRRVRCGAESSRWRGGEGVIKTHTPFAEVANFPVKGRETARYFPPSSRERIVAR